MIFKVIAVMINVGTGTCGPDTGVRCSATFEEGMVSARSYRTLAQCQEAAMATRDKIVEHGWSHNTFCARMR